MIDEANMLRDFTERGSMLPPCPFCGSPSAAYVVEKTDKDGVTKKFRGVITCDDLRCGAEITETSESQDGLMSRLYAKWALRTNNPLTAVPHGWKLVPKEAPRELLTKMAEAFRSGDDWKEIAEVPDHKLEEDHFRFKLSLAWRIGVSNIPSTPPDIPACWCLICRPISYTDPGSMRMVTCPVCGNKRCPKANNHLNDCTGSNDPGQLGSAYP